MSFYHQNIIENRLFSQKSRQKDVLHFFLFCFKKIIFLHFDLWNDLSTLKMILNQQNNTKWIFQTKSHEKEVLHMFLAWFVKNDKFAYLTLKLTFWPWKRPWVMKIIQEMDCPVKITRKWGITLVPGSICWTIIVDLEISGGHFVFDLDNALLALKMTLDHQNNTINGLFRQNPTKKRCYTCSQLYLLKKVFLLIWAWNWRFDLEDDLIS